MSTPKTFYNLEEASRLLGHGRHYFRRNEDMATMAGAFRLHGDFRSRLLFVKEKVDAMAGTIPARKAYKVKVKRVSLPVYRGKVPSLRDLPLRGPNGN